jgi:hypothetical protein
MANRTSTELRNRPVAEESVGRVASSHGGLLRLIRGFATRVAKKIDSDFSRDVKISISPAANATLATAKGRMRYKQATSTPHLPALGVVTEL